MAVMGTPVDQAPVRPSGTPAPVMPDPMVAPAAPADPMAAAPVTPVIDTMAPADAPVAGSVQEPAAEAPLGTEPGVGGTTPPVTPAA